VALHAEVGMIGLGNMGEPMARNLLRRLGSLHVTARSRDRVAGLIRAGATWHDRPSGLSGVGVLLLMLPDLPEAYAVLDGADGVLAHVTAPMVVVVGSTSSAEGTRRLAAHVRTATGGLASVIDAPVSGGVDGAEAATLAIMAGGAPEDFAAVEQVLHCLGHPVLLGPLGSGQVAKACNQTIVAATVLALGEAAALAHRSGLDVEALFALFARGYANSAILQTRGPRIAREDYSVSGPARFMVKDLGFALDEADRTGSRLPLTETLAAVFSDLVERGFGDLDIAVTRAFAESLAPHKQPDLSPSASTSEGSASSPAACLRGEDLKLPAATCAPPPLTALTPSNRASRRQTSR